MNNFELVKVLARRVFRNEEGVTAVEYSMIAALIAGVIIAIVTTIGTTLNTSLTTLSGKL